MSFAHTFRSKSAMIIKSLSGDGNENKSYFKKPMVDKF